MRALFFLVVVVAGIWLWRSLSTAGKTRGTDTARPEPELAAMVQCRYCGVHLPVAEAVTGTNGNYCSQAHLRQSET